MDNKQLVIISLLIIIIACLVVLGIFLISNNNNEHTYIVNNNSNSQESVQENTVKTTSDKAVKNSDGTISYDGHIFNTWSEYRVYRDTIGSPYYAQHKSWDTDGDGYISSKEHNDHNDFNC